jgi:hypothetical protein
MSRKNFEISPLRDFNVQNQLSKAYQKNDLNYKMLITKGHYERTVA